MSERKKDILRLLLFFALIKFLTQLKLRIDLTEYHQKKLRFLFFCKGGNEINNDESSGKNGYK